MSGVILCKKVREVSSFQGLNVTQFLGRRELQWCPHFRDEVFNCILLLSCVICMCMQV